MRGIDFDGSRISTIVSRVRVLELLSESGHKPTPRTGPTWHYWCPLPDVTVGETEDPTRLKYEAAKTRRRSRAHA